MSDTISRQQAIDAFNTSINELIIGGEENAKTVENYLNRVIETIKCLPSAQPKKGKWIRKDDTEIYECSHCGEKFLFMKRLGVKPNHYKFCPNCGADMKGEQDERDS